MTSSAPRASLRGLHPSVDEREEQPLLSGPGVFHLALVLRVSLGAGILKVGHVSLVAWEQRRKAVWLALLHHSHGERTASKPSHQ